MTKSSTKLLVACPHCKCRMPQSSLDKHIKRKHKYGKKVSMPAMLTHSIRPRTLPVSNPKPEPGPLDKVCCPQCNQYMQRRYLNAHLKLHENNNSPKSSTFILPAHSKYHSHPLSGFINVSGSVTIDENGQVLSFKPSSTRQPIARPINPVNRSMKQAASEKTCPICGIDFPTDFVDTHYRNIHLVAVYKTSGKGSQRTIYECIVCHQSLSPGDVLTHRENCHPPKGPSQVLQHLENTDQSWQPYDEGSRPGPYWGTERSDYRESGEGRGSGPSRREWDGKFGSLPLYDDYSEESFPDDEDQ